MRSCLSLGQAGVLGLSAGVLGIYDGVLGLYAGVLAFILGCWASMLLPAITRKRMSRGEPVLYK